MVNEGVVGASVGGVVLDGLVIVADDRGVDDKFVTGDDGFKGVGNASLLLGVMPDFLNGARVDLVEDGFEEFREHAVTHVGLNDDLVGLVSFGGFGNEGEGVGVIPALESGEFGDEDLPVEHLGGTVAGFVFTASRGVNGKDGSCEGNHVSYCFHGSVESVAGESDVGEGGVPLQFGRGCVDNLLRGKFRVYLGDDEVGYLEGVAFHVPELGVEHELEFIPGLPVGHAAFLQVGVGEPDGFGGASDLVFINANAGNRPVVGVLVGFLGDVMGRPNPGSIPPGGEFGINCVFALRGSQEDDLGGVEGFEDGLELFDLLVQLVPHPLGQGVVRDFNVVGNDYIRP